MAAAASDPTTEAGDRPHRSERPVRPSEPLLRQEVILSRRFEIGRAILIVGSLLLLAFYVGKNFDSWRDAVAAGRQ
jgi:hypothetical protein